eukprot:scaffold7214_cov114-Isochrysis_galbana.AAC.7
MRGNWAPRSLGRLPKQTGPSGAPGADTEGGADDDTEGWPEVDTEGAPCGGAGPLPPRPAPRPPFAGRVSAVGGRAGESCRCRASQRGATLKRRRLPSASVNWGGDGGRDEQPLCASAFRRGCGWRCLMAASRRQKRKAQVGWTAHWVEKGVGRAGRGRNSVRRGVGQREDTAERVFGVDRADGWGAGCEAPVVRVRTHQKEAGRARSRVVSRQAVCDAEVVGLRRPVLRRVQVLQQLELAFSGHVRCGHKDDWRREVAVGAEDVHLAGQARRGVPLERMAQA